MEIRWKYDGNQQLKRKTVICSSKVFLIATIMSKVEILIQEIRTLPAEDLQKVIQELLHQADRLQLAKEALEKIAGMGNGLWTTDSQAYIQELRTNER
jgi:hypothetical protein